MSDKSAKYEFLKAVLTDPDLSQAAKCVITALLVNFHNARTGQCNPGFGEIAKAVGRHRSNIVPVINELKRSGWLEIGTTKGGSQRNSNRYRFNFSRRPTSAKDDTGTEDGTSTEDGTGGVPNSHEPVPNSVLEPLKNPSLPFGEREGGEKNPRRRAADAAPREKKEEEEIARAWAEFQQLWNRGHASDDPLKVCRAFVAARAAHGAEAILASARRWAAAREPRFLPEPVKWLGGGWQTEPPPAKADAGARRAGRKRTPAEIAAEHYARLRAEGR